MSDAIGSVSFHPQFAKNRIDTTFRPSVDGEIETAPVSRRPREQERVAYDASANRPRNEGVRYAVR